MELKDVWNHWTVSYVVYSVGFFWLFANGSYIIFRLIFFQHINGDFLLFFYAIVLFLWGLILVRFVGDKFIKFVGVLWILFYLFWIYGRHGGIVPYLRSD